MQGDVSDGSPHYWAFISYSHKDAAFGRGLHRRLERYVLPRRLVARTTSRGAVPRRLAPIFRDREELPAAHDLSTEVRAALKASRNLIVVCSPSSAASTWVSREVEVFRELHPERPVLAAVREGEPPDCFPSALRRSPSGAEIEPLAADFRRDGDGARLGLLKLVAGIAGIGLDELVQRDAHRRNQRVTAVTAAALLVALVMGLSAIYALDARREAERQRAEAEGLVEFMLTDLRGKLKGVGRLDVMTVVNERALNYYGGQDLTHLPTDSLERRARTLHAMGEDDEAQGRLDAALAKFDEAARTTSVLLREDPGDAERIFDEAQSEYWIGSVDYARGRFVAAKRAFLSYKALADELTVIAPGSVKYRKEVGYAESDLCSIAMEKPIDKGGAMKHCAAALRQMEIAAGLAGAHRSNAAANGEIAGSLMNDHANLADAYDINGDIVHARSERDIEARMLASAMASDPRNMDLKDTWVALQLALANLDVEGGNLQAAKDRLIRTRVEIDKMIRFDPKNGRWTQQRAYVEQQLMAHPFTTH